jgi:hypothetical protein
MIRDSVIIRSPRQLQLVMSTTPVTCYGASDGTAAVAVSGGISGYTYVWSNSAASSTAINLPAASYSVVVTDANGCTAMSSAAVVGSPLPLAVVATSTPQSCSNVIDGGVSLSTTGGNPGYQYQWSVAGFSDSFITAQPVGTYRYTVTDTKSCRDTGSATISLLPALVVVPTVTQPLCAPLANGAIALATSGGAPAYTYLWNKGQITSTLNQLLPDTYAVTVTDAKGCQIIDTFNLTYARVVMVEAGDSSIIDFGDQHPLSATTNLMGSLSWSWSPSYQLSCTTCYDPIASPLQTTLYIATVSDIDGCKASDSVLITVNKQYPLYVPNAFTPNADGVNDYFEIYGRKKTWSYVSVEIFNRWGEKIFESNDHDFKWDGTYKGVPQEPGVYVYTLNVTYIDGFRVDKQKGSITIIK